jgi:hypothetical protein
LPDEDRTKARAEIRAWQAEDGKKAMAEYQAKAAAVRANTERLRALRLAREASPQPQAAASAGPAKGKSAKAAPAKRKSVKRKAAV